jgi:hypothetical protein
VRSRRALVVGLAALLLTPGAAGIPDAPSDSSLPQITPVIFGTLGSNGWYVSNVTVNWRVDGPPILRWQGCDPATFTTDTTGARLACEATSEGGTVRIEITIKVDKTPPTATPSPSPQPNGNGWHRAPLTVGFVGSDAMSGPNAGSCTTQAYSGPDTSSREITGTCRDLAGNTSNPSSYTIKYDATRPTATPSPSPQPNAHGWHRAPLTVRFVGSDAMSGPDPASCTTQAYSGPDTSSREITGTCRDLAGNASDASTYTVKYDATRPTATPSPSPQPNAHGWHRAPLTVGFVGSDAMSGPDQPSCTAPQGYSGPETSSREITGTCKDLAGNTSNPSTYTIKYDATRPTATPSPSPQPNGNGWHRAPLTVGFVGSDAMSGPDQPSCTAPQGYSGPETSSREITGTCKDLAGNTSNPSTYTIKYDITPPQARANSRDPDANGWYNHVLRVDFMATDEMSGFDRCDLPKDYTGPDSAAATVSGTCIDKAGNSDVAFLSFKYDGTAPLVNNALPTRPPEPSGWYTKPVVFGFQGSDVLAGIDSCPDVNYDGPDGASVSITGACLDKAGNRGMKSFPLKYDDTGPAVSAVATRGPDANGWYNHPLAVSFAGSDTASGVQSCMPAQGYEGPDSVFAVVTGTCVDKAGNVGLGSLGLKYDSTAPQVSGAIPDRVPDGNGWYNHPLTVNFYGTDATSQVDACTAAGYAGPDNPGASIAGSCRDRAGNQSGASAFAIMYDGTAPSVTGLRIKAGNRSTTLSWDASPDTSAVEIVRRSGKRGAGQTVYRGTGKTFTDPKLENGVRYRYTVTGYDEARNAATREVAATPTAPLMSPQAGATVSAPPRLVWKAAEKATYYNVQVWHRGRVFSAWPTGTSIQLRRSWTYAGRRYRLTAGRYRWYVWPGYGRRAEKKFGRLLGSSSFVVR